MASGTPMIANDDAEDGALVSPPDQAAGRQPRRWRRQALACGLSSLALGSCVALLHPWSSAQREAKLQLHGLQEKSESCEEYFNMFEDCSARNLWECGGDDGTLGYSCCCEHGWGNFAVTPRETTGMINWAPHPDKCVDLSEPYMPKGEGFDRGHAIFGSCYWGSNNKHFNLPTSGKGMIHWATHPKYCMAVKDGKNAVGTRLQLQLCWSVPKSWTEFDIDDRGDGSFFIRWALHPSKCFRITGVKDPPEDGAEVQLGECHDPDKLDRFSVLPLHQPPPMTDYPRLFCVSLMLPFGGELELIRTQWEHQVGIFKCHDYAVYSNVSITFGHGDQTVTTDIMPGSMAVQFGGRWGTALNTDIFIRFWGKVLEDIRAWRNHWTVKLDPDSVFFAWRLQEVISSMWKNGDAGAPVYLNNCHLGMHGPIEVLGRHALSVYSSRHKECVEGEPYKHKQEDVYFRKCWELLGIKKVNVYNLLLEIAYACDEIGSSGDGRHPCFAKQVSFHPFKSPQGYLECYGRGDSMKWSTPMAASARLPTLQNHKHDD